MLLLMVALRLARRQIIAYGILAGLLDLVIWLPGDPFYESTRSFLATATFQVLIVWRLWHRSRPAWVLAFLVALLSILLLGVLRLEFGTAAELVVLVAQVLVLTASSIWAYVWSTGRVPAASS